MVNVTAIGRTLSIMTERKEDVDYILSTVDREPVFVNDLVSYQNYLWDPSLPKLLSDDKEKVLMKLHAEFGVEGDTTKSLNQLKDLLNIKIEERKREKIEDQVKSLKEYELYNEIEEMYKGLNNSYDPSLFLEWNTWRAMTMLDGGNIQTNLKFDDNGQPMSTALGNKADIVCDYGDFDVTVEVTMAKGALQWKMEGEPVPRHIGQHKEEVDKPTYCFFIAPLINKATIAHFYILHISNIDMYGGRCCIIPIQLSTFRKMLKDAVESPSKPTSTNIKTLFDMSMKYARECFIDNKTENDWYEKVTSMVSNWLSATRESS